MSLKTIHGKQKHDDDDDDDFDITHFFLHLNDELKKVYATVCLLPKQLLIPDDEELCVCKIPS